MANNMISDNELIETYKKSRDTAILAQLYEPYMDLVYGVAMKYLGSHEDAQDAVIDIYEELISKLIRYEVNYFKAWLYQLSRNHCLMILRKRKTKPGIINMDIMQNDLFLHPMDDLEKELKLNRLEKCLKTLQEKQKIAIHQFYIQGKCYAEIANLTGEETGKIRSQIQNGRRNLRLCMEHNPA